MNIRYVAGELLLDSNRVSYTQISIDIEVRTSIFQTHRQFY